MFFRQAERQRFDLVSMDEEEGWAEDYAADREGDAWPRDLP
jgi:hypothetical protein